MGSRLIWHGKKVFDTFKKQARQNVLDAAILLEKVVKESMKAGGTTESGETVIKKGTKTVRLDKVTGKKAGKINEFRSKPGEVPRVQFGKLKGSITHEVHPILPISRAGTNIKYGKWLEFGTKNMSPRPFMRPALHKIRPAIAALWMRPLSRGFTR